MFPPELTALALARRDVQQRLAADAVLKGQRWWKRLDPANLRGSWAAIVGPAVLSMVASAQQQAAAGAQGYVSDAVAVQGVTPAPAGTVSVSALVGVASDGRPLESLLAGPLWQVLDFVGQGVDVDEALGRGRSALDRILAQQVQDAARVAVGVAQVADRSVRAWVRQTVPPSCSRCIILAGKVSHVREAFKRHPFCDCVNVPAAEVIEPPSPRALFNKMSDAELKAAGWTEGDVQAIRDGADIYQVTNAHRGLQTMTAAGHQVQTTTYGATRKGLAGTRLGARRGQVAVRLTPEQIYLDADRYGLSRDQTIDLLRRNGYIF